MFGLFIPWRSLCFLFYLADTQYKICFGLQWRYFWLQCLRIGTRTMAVVMYCAESTTG